MPLVDPLEKGSSPEVERLASFFDETLGFTPNSVLTMQRRPAIAEAFINLNKAVMANEGRVSRPASSGESRTAGRMLLLEKSRTRSEPLRRQPPEIHEISARPT
jgi:hypothetical protein